MAVWHEVEIELLKAGVEKYTSRFGRISFGSILSDPEFYLLHRRFGLTDIQSKWAELLTAPTEATPTGEPTIENSHDTESSILNGDTVVRESLHEDQDVIEDTNTFSEERGLSLETKSANLLHIDSVNLADRTMNETTGMVMESDYHMVTDGIATAQPKNTPVLQLELQTPEEDTNSLPPHHQQAALDEERKLDMRRIIESMSSKTGIYSKQIKGLSDELSDYMSYLSKLDKEDILNVFPDIGCVDDDSDHLFGAPRGKRSYDKPVCPETLDAEFLSLVENGLEGIYLRFYNSGLGLLRAVIVGDEGTPYSDGLFFFDIKLPLGYGGHSSILEPTVRYHWHLSGGESINPNIHKLGEVVLSYTKRDKVGNTKKGHIWDPLKLSIGHLLYAIKSKLLNDDPFHSLIPNDRSTVEKQKSLLYNEIIIIRSLDTMIRTMSSPPQHFEVFVVSHFKRRAAAILARCKSYVQVRDNSKLEPRGTRSFVRDVIERMERLYASFSSIGVMDEQMTEKIVQLGSWSTYMKQESITPTVPKRMSDLDTWFQKAETTRTVANSPRYILDLCDPWFEVGGDFWANLLYEDLPDLPRSGWIEDLHIRAWTNCLRRSRKPDDDWTVMGPDFFNAFGYGNYITQQADGTMSGWPPWWSVTRVFFPVNWDNRHWILGLLDLQTWKLFIFDSSAAVYGAEFDVNVVYGDLFKDFRGNIGLLLQLIKYFENLDQKFEKVDLKIVSVEVPQQCNERDCGIFTCMNMYQLTKVTKPPLAGPEEFRLLMQAELSKHSNAMMFRGFMAGQLSENVFDEIPESV